MTSPWDANWGMFLKKLSKKYNFRDKNIKKLKVQNDLSLFFKANELPRTRSLFLPLGSSDNPTPTAPKARVYTGQKEPCKWKMPKIWPNNTRRIVWLRRHLSSWKFYKNVYERMVNSLNFIKCSNFSNHTS